MRDNTIATSVKGVGGWLLAMAIALLLVGPSVTVIRTLLAIRQLQQQDAVPTDGLVVYALLSLIVMCVAVALQTRAGWLLRNRLVPETPPVTMVLIWLEAVVCSPILCIAVPALCLGLDREDLSRGLMWVSWSVTLALVCTLYLSRSYRAQQTYGLPERSARKASVAGHRATATAASFWPIVSAGLRKPAPALLRANVKAAPVVSLVKSAKPVAASASVPVKTEEADEQLWASALNEFEGTDRRAGLWARAYAHTDGNEAQAKARYLKQRVAELQEVDKGAVFLLKQAEFEESRHYVKSPATSNAEVSESRNGEGTARSALFAAQTHIRSRRVAASFSKAAGGTYGLPRSHQIQVLMQQVREGRNSRSARRLATLSGYRVVVHGGGFFEPTYYEVFANEDEKSLISATADEFVDWVVETLC